MSMILFPTPIYPGVDPDANEGGMITAVTIVFVVISAVTISLRIFSRWWTKIEFWADDYLILFAAVRTRNPFLSIGQTFCRHVANYIMASFLRGPTLPSISMKSSGTSMASISGEST